MKILLIQPPVDSEKIKVPFSHAPPLGLLYIAKVLEQKDHSLEVLDFSMEYFSKEKILDAISSVDLVGISITAFCIESAARITEIIKREDSKISVLIGGPMCCIEPRQTLIDTKADICVEGEGENVIVRVVEALENKDSFNSIPGIFYKKNGIVKKGKPSEIIQNIDLIQFPSRHLVDKYNYGYAGKSTFSWFKGRLTSLITSRGCPFNCKFCCVPSILKKYRYRSVENIIEELDQLDGVYDTIYIRDDNFLVNKKRAIIILDEIIKRNYNFEFWVPGVRASLADEILFTKMRDAGVKIIQIGIESGNQDVLDFYNKKTTLHELKNAVEMARKMGFFTGGNFIVGAPFETEQHFKNTYSFATKLPLDIFSCSTLKYYKGSQLWEMARNNNKINENEYFVEASSERGLSNFSQKNLNDLCLSMGSRFYFRPKYIVDQFIQSFVHKDWRLYKIGFTNLIEWFIARK